MTTERTLVGRLYDGYVDAESRVSAAAESVIGSDYFAKLFATSVSNAMALAGLANRSLDRGVHASRIAGRADVAGIGQQLARTEDKLEAVLQLVEAQQNLLAAMQARLDDAVNGPAAMHTASAAPVRDVPPRNAAPPGVLPAPDAPSPGAPARKRAASAQHAATSSRSTKVASAKAASAKAASAKAAGRAPSMGTRPANAPSRSSASGRRRTP